ncbi:MAG: hypothetical protein OIF57_13165 [Marinobacterium sp.]|nr:hypothetical protein [Marinobacterium sp.]
MLKIITTLALYTSLLISSGCFHWVTNGHDGMAEADPVAQHRNEPLAQRNAQTLLECQHRLHLLMEQDAREIAPARLHQARMVWIRATREHSNGLDAAAHQQLLKLQQQISAIEDQLARWQPASMSPPRGIAL